MPASWLPLLSRAAPLLFVDSQPAAVAEIPSPHPDTRQKGMYQVLLQWLAVLTEKQMSARQLIVEVLNHTGFKLSGCVATCIACLVNLACKRG